MLCYVFFWIVTFRIATLKDCKVKYFTWKKKLLLKSKSLRKKQFFHLKCSLRTPNPSPPLSRTRWIVSPRKNPAYGPESLDFFNYWYKKVIFYKGVRAKVLGLWRNRTICSLNVALTRCWTHVEGKDISQIWDETLVFPCGHPEVAIGYLPNAHETRVFDYDLFWITYLINCD